MDSRSLSCCVGLCPLNLCLPCGGYRQECAWLTVLLHSPTTTRVCARTHSKKEPRSFHSADPTAAPSLHMLISNPEKRLLGTALLSGSFAIQIQPPSSPLHIFRNLPAFLGSCCNLLMVTGPRTSWWFGINNLRGNPAVNYLNTFTGGTGPKKDAMSSPTRRLTQILRTIQSSPGHPLRSHYAASPDGTTESSEQQLIPQFQSTPCVFQNKSIPGAPTTWRKEGGCCPMFTVHIV